MPALKVGTLEAAILISAPVAGLRADALGAGLDLKRAKADELDLFAFLEGCGDGIESGGDDGFGFLLGNAGLFSGSSNEFGLIHGK